MALSNWDTMAFDDDGKPCAGVLFSDSPNRAAEIYKNWLYIRDADLWKEGGRFVHPTIEEISESGPFESSVFRGYAVYTDQNAFFVYVTDSSTGQRMAGIACYGYETYEQTVKRERPAQYSAIPAAFWTFDYSHFSGGGKGGEYWGVSVWSITPEKLRDTKLSFILEHEKIEVGPMSATKYTDGDEEYYQIEYRFDGERPESRFVGVSPETTNAFRSWLIGIAPKYAASIDFDHALRFNQGDAFFAANLDSDIPATAVGESEQPFLNQMVNLVVFENQS